MPHETSTIRVSGHYAIHWASTGTVNNIGEWLASNQDSPIYDDITHNFVRQVREVDPESARAWVDTIKNEKQRVKLLQELGQ